jgi:uncharacterized membrane protein YdjX (TVP38/TMEM64 family)
MMATDDPLTHAATVRRRWVRLALLAVFVGAVVAFVALGGPRYLSLDTIQSHRDSLLLWTRQHFAASLAIAFLVYAGAVAFSIPGAVILSLTIGFLFGRWVGTVLVVAAATIGAVIVFAAARYVFADAARKRLGAFGERINAGFTANAFHYMLFLRLVPVFPFFLVNLAPAFTSITLRTFALATLIGIVPATFVFVNLGETLSRIDSLQGLVSAETLGALALLGLLALLPVLWKRRSRGRPTDA